MIAGSDWIFKLADEQRWLGTGVRAGILDYVLVDEPTLALVFYGTPPDWLIERRSERFGALVLDRAPAFACCGLAIGQSGSAGFTVGSQRHYRCAKHVGRNPCAIEGCARTTKASHGYSSDDWLCGAHWRAHVPPHSALRRTYRRFFKLAKKRGDWDDALKARFWRFWRGLIERARWRERGDIDMTEINKLFGWDEAA